MCVIIRFRGKMGGSNPQEEKYQKSLPPLISSIENSNNDFLSHLTACWAGFSDNSCVLLQCVRKFDKKTYRF
jgi:hypothetical protein